ncbi:MAG: hypothetical protein AAGI72_23625 [Pseudomonadota bacterium]
MATEKTTVVHHSVEVGAASAAKNAVIVSSGVSTIGGAWAWLGDNAPQFGIIIGLVGVLLGGVSMYRQDRELKRMRQNYERSEGSQE